MTRSKSEKELWDALQALDDDLLNPNLSEELLDQELKASGVDAIALSNRGREFIATAKGEERLSWQLRAQERRDRLAATVERTRATVSSDMDRTAILARLEVLRVGNPAVGTAINMAARKRKPEESTDEELKALLEEMEALRAIEESGE